MKIDIHRTPDLLSRHAIDIEQILQRAGLEALREHRRARNLVATMQDGKVALIDPATVPGIDDPPEADGARKS
jgi:16S rRNA C1402 (ribose-2'-O) methylase RsmI